MKKATQRWLFFASKRITWLQMRQQREQLQEQMRQQREQQQERREQEQEQELLLFYRKQRGQQQQ
jgi:hypothetical protein